MARQKNDWRNPLKKETENERLNRVTGTYLKGGLEASNKVAKSRCELTTRRRLELAFTAALEARGTGQRSSSASQIGGL